MFEHIDDASDLQAAVLAINVKDYGDFKRKVVLYLNRFAEEHKLTDTQRNHVRQIVERVQFQATSDIEKIRNWTIDQISRLKTG